MTERVFSGVLDVAGLQAIVDALRQNARFAIVERIDAIDFPLPQCEPVDVQQWPKGRIFDEPFELRWEKDGGRYRVIATGEGDFPSLPGHLNELEQLSGRDEPCSYYCWKETDPRLGRTLSYRCVPGEGNVRLIVREYRDDHGRLTFWRYLRMEREGGAE